MSASIIVCCGSGGVGKTTTSAALALKLATEGARVVVLTIDPAKRLADSLNVGEIGGTPTRVPLDDCGGHCDAVMLDVPKTFVDLIHQFATSEQQAQRILENRYFQFASTRLSGVHEYMAAEKVRALATCGEYEVVVVDTPPSRNALDFLSAPQRLAGLMDGGVIRWLATPATKRGWKALEVGSEAISKILRKLIGDATIIEIADFFDAFRGLWDGFYQRSIEVQELLRGSTTSFLLVTSPATTARSEALFFLAQLDEKNMRFAGFLINRVQVEPIHIPSRSIFPPPGPATNWEDLYDFVAEAPAQQARLARLHNNHITAIKDAGPKGARVWIIPDHGRPVNSLEDLVELGSHLPSQTDL